MSADARIPGSSSRPCPAWEEALLAAVWGGEWSEGLDDHCRVCPACAAALESERELAARTRSAAAQALPDGARRGLAQAVFERTTRAGEERREALSSAWLGWGALAAGSAAVALWFARRPPEDPPDMDPELAEADIELLQDFELAQELELLEMMDLLEKMEDA
jgi:hypothetical protein